VSLWRGGDGALIWDAKTTGSDDSGSGVSSSSAAATAAAELDNGKVLAVLARNGVSAYASVSGALAWSLDATQLSGLASSSSSSSGNGGAVVQWSDIVPAASGKNSGACVVGLSSSNGKLAVVDLKRSNGNNKGNQGRVRQCTCLFYVCVDDVSERRLAYTSVHVYMWLPEQRVAFVAWTFSFTLCSFELSVYFYARSRRLYGGHPRQILVFFLPGSSSQWALERRQRKFVRSARRNLRRCGAFVCLFFKWCFLRASSGGTLGGLLFLVYE